MASGAVQQARAGMVLWHGQWVGCNKMARGAARRQPRRVESALTSAAANMLPVC